MDLQFLLNNGIIDLSDIQSMIAMSKRKQLIDSFKLSHWQIETGRYKGMWCVKLPDKTKSEKRRVVRRKTESEILDIIAEYQKQFVDNPSIGELFNEWNDRRLELKKISKSSHTRLRQVYKRHYSDFGKNKIKDMSADTFIDFLEEQIPTHNLSSKAFASLKSITKGTLKYAKRKGYIGWSPDTMLADLDVTDSEFKKIVHEDYEEVFDESEMYDMISYLSENLDMRNSAILLMFITGMRIGEVVALRHEDINLISDSIKIRRTETRYKNGDNTVFEVKDYPKTKNSIREIVIPTAYQWLLRDLYFHPTSSGYLFEENGKRVTSLLVRKRTYSVCKKVGAYKKSPHKIRATYDTILLDNGIDKRFVKDQMGHADIRTSENNYHRNRKHIDDKRNIIDAIKEFQAV